MVCPIGPDKTSRLVFFGLIVLQTPNDRRMIFVGKRMTPTITRLARMSCELLGSNWIVTVVAVYT